MAVKFKEDSFFSYLCKLENDHRPVLSNVQVERASLAQLQQQVVQLCQQRDRIKQQLEIKTKQLNFVKNKSGFIETRPKLNFSQQKYLLEEILDIYGLMGIKVCYSKKNNMLMKFTSTSNGFYQCTYNLEICFFNDQIKVESYNLPPFIPLDSILDKKSFNIPDVCSVAKEILEYLYAYSVRDKDIHETLERFGPSMITCMQYSLARELVCFKLIRHDCVLDCKLSYLNLLAILPEEISIQSTDLAQRYSSEWLHQFQESSGMFLVELHLPSAISSIIQAIDAAAAEFVHSSTEPSSNSSSESSSENKVVES